MKDRKKDKFETFLEESLSDYSENPSDMVWKNLESKIPEPPKKSYYFLGRNFLMLSLCLFVIGYWWKSTSEISNVNLTLQNQEAKINSIVKEVEEINSNINNESLPTNQSIEKNTEQKELELKKNQYSEKPKNENKIINSKFHNNTISTIPNFSSTIESTKKIITNSIGTNNTFSIKTSKKENSLVKTSNDFEQISLQPKEDLLKTSIERLPSIYEKLNLNVDNKESLNKIDLVDLIGKDNFNNGFEFYSFYGAIFPNINLQSSFQNSKKQNSKNFSIGLLYNIRANEKLSLQFGFEFTERTIGVNFNKQLQYDNTETLISNNQYRSKNTYQINSNYGNQLFISYLVTTKMNDGMDIETGEYFDTKINIIRTQRYFAIPMFFKFHFSNPYKKLQWTSKIGVLNRIFFDVNDIGEVSIHNISHPRLIHENTIVENNEHGNVASRFGVELAASAGMEYHFNKHWGIIIEPTFKINILETTPYNPFTLGIYSGLRWSF